MTGHNRSVSIVCILLSLGALTSLACGGDASSASQSVVGPATGVEGYDQPRGSAWDKKPRPSRWRLVSPPSGRKLRIYSDVGWCVGTPKPRFGRIDVASRKNAVLLTAFVVAYMSSDRKSVCAGVEYAVVKTVVLPGKLGDRPLYDGSTSPPKKRWPK
jgi:hypothetical protein